jgi:hypothetical protein
MRDEVLANIIEKMATDADFRKQVEDKPGKALVEAGLTWDEVGELKNSGQMPDVEALGERASAAFTPVGELWYKISGGRCGCTSSWITGSSTGAIIAFC